VKKGTTTSGGNKPRKQDRGRVGGKEEQEHAAAGFI